MPMLLSKCIVYDEQKHVAEMMLFKLKYLIIDEAHNILNAEYQQWRWLQDYRLSIFEIIKEGRKFGFIWLYQANVQADISPTIMSQLHNYLIHRLVNEKDLKMLENTICQRLIEILPNDTKPWSRRNYHYRKRNAGTKCLWK